MVRPRIAALLIRRIVRVARACHCCLCFWLCLWLFLIPSHIIHCNLPLPLYIFQLHLSLWLWRATAWRRKWKIDGKEAAGVGDADRDGEARGSSRLTAVPVRSTLDWLLFLVLLVSSTHANVQSAHMCIVHTHSHTYKYIHCNGSLDFASSLQLILASAQ